MPPPPFTSTSSPCPLPPTSSPLHPSLSGYIPANSNLLFDIQILGKAGSRAAAKEL